MKTFDEAFITFIAKCQAISDKNMERFKNLDNPVIEPNGGVKFIHVTSRDPDDLNGRAHCFVAVSDGNNKTFGTWKKGDVFKPANWKSPAKGARGNIFDENNGVGRMGPYGPEYNYR